MTKFSSPFMAKSPLGKKPKLIKPETGMLVPPDGSKLQQAIHNDNMDLSNKEIRQANREYKKTVREYNKENNTNYSLKPKRKKNPIKMEQEVDPDARADANPGYTQWRFDTAKATKKPVPDSEESLKRFKKWKAAQEANKKENDTIKKG